MFSPGASREGARRATGREAPGEAAKVSISRLIDYIELMKKKYPKEFKDSIIARMLPPSNARIPDLARETGISRDTLYCWRIKHRNANGSVRQNYRATDTLSSEDKFSIVIVTAGMNEVELSEYCRQKGLYPEQIASWRASCRQANASQGNKINQKEVRHQAKEIKELIADGLVDTIYITKLDRLYRSIVEGSSFIKLCLDNSVNIITTLETTDTTTSTGMLQIHLLMSIADYERNCIADRTWSGRREIWR